MLNIDKINMVYLACGVTDLRKSIDGLSILVQSTFNLNPFEQALFVFCNRNMDKLKILHFDNGFWLYYYRLENGRFKWPMTKEEALQIDIKEFEWLLKGYEVRVSSKFKPIREKNHY